MARPPMNQPEATGADFAERVELLTNELSRVRQRGIDYLDRSQGRQRAVDTPFLDGLAEAGGFPLVGARSEQLSYFIQKRLQTYGERYEVEAQFIQGLFVDANGRTPGPGGPSGLLRHARRHEHLSAPAFRRLQRLHFADFARYLLTVDEAPRRRLPLAAPLVVGLGLMALAAIAVTGFVIALR